MNAGFAIKLLTLFF